MKPTPKKPPSKPAGLDTPYVPGDPIPAPDVVEKSTDTTWALWTQEVATHEARFADTQPPSSLMNVSGSEGGYAATVPSPLSSKRGGSDPTGGGADRVPAKAGVSLDELITESRRNNRVCPKPDRWQQLFNMLLEGEPGVSGKMPSPPLIGQAWLATPSLSKRMSFRDHLEWAGAHGGLEIAASFIKQLREDEWYHMGE